MQEEDTRQRRVENSIRCGGEKVAGSTSPPTMGKRGRERGTTDAHYAEWESTSCVMVLFLLHILFGRHPDPSAAD